MKDQNIHSSDLQLSVKSNTTDSRGIQAVLKYTGFRKLWIGQIFSQLADKFYIILMVYMIAQYWVSITPESNETLAGVAAAIRMNFETRAQRITLLATGIYIANTVPAMFLGTIAGIGADIWPKRRIMVTSNGLRALLVLLTPLCLLPGPTWLSLSWGYWALLIMTFLESSLTQFFAPAEQAAIPLLVPNDHLLAANSLYQATSMGATIVGFALGDPILRLLKNTFLLLGIEGGEFLLLPLCYGIAAIVLSTVSLQEHTNHLIHKNVFKEIGEGLNVLKEKPSVRGAIVHLVVLYSLLAALYVLAISLASSIKGLGPTNFGLLLAMCGLGISLGAIFLAQIGHLFTRRKLTSAGLGSIAFSLILLGQFKGSLLMTLLLCGGLGIGAALVAIPAQTTLQQDTPLNQRGKVFGLQNNLINIALSLPLVLAGALVGSFGVVPVLWLLASFALVATLLERPWKRC